MRIVNLEGVGAINIKRWKRKRAKIFRKDNASLKEKSKNER